MNKHEMIKIAFEKKADSENAVKMSKYMRDMFDFYGIPTPKRKECYGIFLKEEKKNKMIDWEFLNERYLNEHRVYWIER